MWCGIHTTIVHEFAPQVCVKVCAASTECSSIRRRRVDTTVPRSYSCTTFTSRLAIMETIEYEMARNMTLLFFLERLLDKGEPRTLHDLSCQFGAKGFTKEMRQIAGGSQSGKRVDDGNDMGVNVVL